MRQAMRLCTMGLVMLASACSTTGPREREAENLAEFERHAGAPVESFHFWRMDRWETLGRDRLVVWTRLNEAWLLKVAEPCSGLEFANALALSSTNNRVYRSFDAVLFEKQRCRIAEIRPVDGKALKAEQRAGAAEPSGAD